MSGVRSFTRFEANTQTRALIICFLRESTVAVASAGRIRETSDMLSTTSFICFLHSDCRNTWFMEMEFEEVGTDQICCYMRNQTKRYYAVYRTGRGLLTVRVYSSDVTVEVNQGW